MSWIARALRLLTARSRLVGPGRLVLVVGPSGAGKDTLIARARAACRGDATVVFPARVITRPPSIFEDNEFMPPSAFEQAAANGAFAVWWSAHGHMYGIPLAVDFDIEAGRTVVCNVSRTVVAAVRALRQCRDRTRHRAAGGARHPSRLARAGGRCGHRGSNEPRGARGRQVAA